MRADEGLREPVVSGVQNPDPGGNRPWERQLQLVSEVAGVPTVCTTYCVHHQLA